MTGEPHNPNPAMFDDPFLADLLDPAAPTWPPTGFTPPVGAHPVEGWLDEFLRVAERSPGMLFPETIIVQTVVVGGVAVNVVFLGYMEMDDDPRGVVEVGGMPLVDVHRARLRADPSWPNASKVRVRGFHDGGWIFCFAIKVEEPLTITRYISGADGRVVEGSAEEWAIEVD